MRAEGVAARTGSGGFDDLGRFRRCNGNFSGGAAGFWIENGKIAFPVKGLTIAGTAEEMLQGIDLVGDDLDLTRGTTAPTFRIKLLQIGGE